MITLKPSLEGWKRFSAAGRRGGSATLKPSLEGWKPGGDVLEEGIA